MKNEEHHHQVAVFDWLDLISRDLPQVGGAFAIPNGGHRHKVVALKLQREGVKPGVPDQFLPIARSGYHGLFIELKASKGRLTHTQKVWLSFLNSQGYRAEVAHGAEENIEIYKNYLGLK